MGWFVSDFFNTVGLVWPKQTIPVNVILHEEWFEKINHGRPAWIEQPCWRLKFCMNFFIVFTCHITHFQLNFLANYAIFLLQLTKRWKYIILGVLYTSAGWQNMGCPRQQISSKNSSKCVCWGLENNNAINVFFLGKILHHLLSVAFLSPYTLWGLKYPQKIEEKSPH